MSDITVLSMVYLKSLKYCIHVLRDEYGYMIVGNYDLYREKLQRVDWDELINSGNSLDDLCESFSNVILQAAGETIPNKIITVRKTDPP